MAVLLLPLPLLLLLSGQLRAAAEPPPSHRVPRVVHGWKTGASPATLLFLRPATRQHRALPEQRSATGLIQLSSEQPSFSIPVCLAAGILMAPAEALLPLPLPPLLLLLLSEQLVMTAGVHGTSHQSQPCGPDEYNADGLCCKLCDAGQQVREHCTSPHTKADCVACANGTFAVHPNGDTSCFPCSSCSKDKEVAQQCSPVRDVRCRCPQGSFEHEDQGSCRPCTNCAGGRVLQQCSATRDAVCGEENQDFWNRQWIGCGIAVMVIIIIAVFVICRNRGSGRASTKPSCRSCPPDQAQPSEDSEQGQPAHSEELEALMQNGGSASTPGHPGISEDPVEDIELLEVVVNGNPVHTVGMRQHQDPSDPESGGALPQCSGAGLLSISEDSPGRSAPRLSAHDGLHTADHPIA